jgi:hypothetical protein
MADRAQIQEILYLYCRGIDRVQTGILAQIFHIDAMIDKGAGPYPVAQWIGEVAARQPQIPRASHMVTNFLIDFLDEDSAFVESWALALEQHPGPSEGDTGVDHVFRARYGDVFERREGAWRIALRTYVADHTLNVAVIPALAPKSTTVRSMGRRDASDPVLEMRTRLGL